MSETCWCWLYRQWAFWGWFQSRYGLPLYLVLCETDPCCLHDFWKEHLGMNEFWFLFGYTKVTFLRILIKTKGFQLKSSLFWDTQSLQILVRLPTYLFICLPLLVQRFINAQRKVRILLKKMTWQLHSTDAAACTLMKLSQYYSSVRMLLCHWRGKSGGCHHTQTPWVSRVALQGLAEQGQSKGSISEPPFMWALSSSPSSSLP